MRKIRNEIEKMIELLEELNHLVGDLDHIHSEKELECLSDKIIDCREAVLFDMKLLQKRISEFL